MAHDHDHSHPQVLTRVNAALITGIILNFLFVVVEVVFGLYTHSLSLLSDAGHNLADVASLGLSLLAFKLLKVRSNKNYTYGYRKTSILVALFNSIVLLLSVGAIVYEAAQRFFHPAPLPGKTIAIVAGIGILINGFTGMMFFSNKDKDMNLRSAYLHLMSDALVSLALVIGGVVIIYTGWYWIDPALSIVVALVILFGTWRLLKDSLRLSMDGMPDGISLEEVSAAALGIAGVHEFHHVHIWSLSTSENALTAHLVLAPGVSLQEERTIKDELRHRLEHLNIHHVTIETEHASDGPCTSEDC